MKICIVAQPANPRSSADLIELLKGAPWQLPKESITETELGPGAAPEDRARIRTLCDRLATASARLPADSARIHCVLTECERENATESPAAAAVTQTSKPRDLNGSAAHAVLPKLLASAALAAARPGFERVQRADLLSTAKNVSSQVRVSSQGETEQSPLLVSARFSTCGNQAAALDGARAVACAGAVPIAIATAVTLESGAGAGAFAALLERLVAVTEIAAELGVAAIWIHAVSGDGGVVTFGRIEQAEQLTGPFPGVAGDRLVFLGETATDIEGSCYLPAVQGQAAGPAPDYSREKKLYEVLQTLAKAQVITAAHSVGAGGLLVAVCGMLLAGEKPFGARLDVTSLGGTRADALLFGEIHGRAVVAVAADRVGTVISEAHMHGVSAALIGEVTAEPLLELKTRSLATEWRVAELRDAWRVGGEA